MYQQLAAVTIINGSACACSACVQLKRNVLLNDLTFIYISQGSLNSMIENREPGYQGNPWLEEPRFVTVRFWIHSFVILAHVDMIASNCNCGITI